MTIDPIQFAASTSTAATDGVRIAADSLDTGTATEVYVQVIKFGYGTEGVYNQVATGAGLPVAADAANPVFVQITSSGTATQAVDVSAWSATDLNVNLAQTATVAITGTVSLATTATTPVTITNASVPVTVATEVILATGNVIDVSAATTATQAVTITNTSLAITQATESIVTQDTATDMNVTPFQGTATELNAIVQIAVPRANVSTAFNSTTATTSVTLATATTNAYKDMTAIHVVNGSTTALGIIIESAATATHWHHELAAEGGGFTLSFPIPVPQEQQATNWTFELDAATSASNPVSVFAQFITVT
jgi:hypothetical protein